MTSLGESCAVSRYRILHNFYTRRPNIEWLPTHIENPRFEQIAYEANSDTVFPTDTITARTCNTHWNLFKTANACPIVIKKAIYTNTMTFVQSYLT